MNGSLTQSIDKEEIRMRRCILLAIGLLLMLQCGCAVHEWVFAAFGDSYSGGGVSRLDRQDHFNREIERGRNYQQNGSEVVSDVPWH